MNQVIQKAGLAIWTPVPEPEAARAKQARAFRTRAMVQSGIGLGLGVGIWWLWSPVVAMVAVCLSLLTLGLGLVSPLGAFRRLHRLLDRAGGVLGRVMSLVLLGPMFYLVFTPLGLLLRRGANDRLHRRFDPEAPSYFVTPPPTQRDEAAFRRQF